MIAIYSVTRINAESLVLLLVILIIYISTFNRFDWQHLIYRLNKWLNISLCLVLKIIFIIDTKNFFVELFLDSQAHLVVASQCSKLQTRVVNDRPPSISSTPEWFHPRLLRHDAVGGCIIQRNKSFCSKNFLLFLSTIIIFKQSLNMLMILKRHSIKSLTAS